MLTQVGDARVRRRILTLVIAVLAAVAALSVYLLTRGTPASTALKVANAGNEGGSAGVIMPNVPLRTPYVYIMDALCVDKGATATITSVVAAKPKGSIEVVDWAVRDSADLYASSPLGDGIPGKAMDLSGFGHVPITEVCSTSARGGSAATLALSVQIKSRAAAANGFTIHFRSGGRNGTTFAPFYVTECTGAKCPRLADNA